MLFNSYTFLLLFLPLCLLGFFAATHERVRRPRGWLIGMSLLFYAWWDPAYLLLLAASISLNYGSAHALMHARGTGNERAMRWILGTAVGANIALLGWFKYLDFAIGIVNDATGAALPLAHLVLPLAISFYTLVQIAFLCDLRAGKVVDLDIRNYLLFVCFFPHMIAGPIIHHSEMMPQFNALAGRRPDAETVARGSFLFAIGLFKKVCIADTLARAADSGFATASTLDFAGGWITALGYSLQLYFDFSGYSDMAIGLALLFGIQFPLNFDSPYKARDIREFWHRWHMTLSRFLRDYVYVPLGGNRGGAFRTQRNLFLTFLVGGLWHGAGWPFVIWGALHGAAMVVHRSWAARGMRLPRTLGWLLCFLFVVLAFVMFRAPSVDTALSIYAAMLDVGSLDTQSLIAWRIDPAGSAVLAWLNAIDVPGLGLDGWPFVAACLLLALLAPNSNRLAEEFQPTAVRGLACALLLLLSTLALVAESPFIYFQF